jgi:tape measure domain-containing protein|tara:strand:+ start:138 stop:2450 length:2313 start_codon:yes stop_codon:yes gene_type:complete
VAGQVVVELTAQDKVSGVLNRINGASRNLQKNLGGAAKRVGDSFKNLQSRAVSLQGVLGSLGVGAVVKSLADAGVQADRTAKRLKFLGDQFGESAKLQQFANEAAEKFTLGQTDAANAVGDLFGRLRPMGTSLEDIKTVFNGVNVAAKQMNLSTADTEGVMLQLSQALGSGKLQGDEFRSIMERLPKIGQAVAKSMGVTVGQLKDLSSKGKLTTDVIIKALKDIEKQGFPESDGVRQFNKAMKDLSTTIGQRLTPILDPILKGIAGLVGKFLELPEPVQAAVIGFTAVATAFAAIAPLLPVIAAGIGAVVAVLTGPVGIVAGIAGVVAAFVTMKGKAEETKEPMSQVSTEADQTKAAIEAAARAKQQFIDKTKEHISALEAENAQISAAEQAYENTVKVTDARLNAESEINKLQGQILERAYEQAGSARERLTIAKQIYQNEVEGARIAYQQTLNSIKAEQQRLEFRRQAAAVEVEIIKAKGALNAEMAGNDEKAKAILEKTQNLVEAQRQNVRVIEGQIKAQGQIAEQQKIAAEAVFRQKELAARQKLEQKLIGDNLVKNKTEARNLSTNLSKSNTNSQNLATATGRVASNAQNSSFMFIRVAQNASAAANQISRAAAAQERLNRARRQKSSSGGSGGSGGGTAQAEGGYNLGSFTPFARGGVVKGPTLGLIGEGGEPEYIIPQSKAAGFAANFLSGKRGASAIPGFSEGGMAVPSTASVNIQTGPVTQMDGQNFVTTADLGAAVEAGVMQVLDMMRRDQMTRSSMGLN